MNRPRPPARSPSLGAPGLVVALAGGLVGLLPGEATAGGFEIPDYGARALGRGGATVVSPVDGTALHYNPGALAKQRGTRITYNHSLIWHDTRFARAPLSDAWGDDAGTTFEEARNAEKLFPLGAFGVVSTDFGLDNWTFALGGYGPHSVGKHDYAEYGPQSFMLTDMNVLLVYYSAAAAWKLRDVFGIGVTAQYVDLLQLDYSLVTDSTFATTLNAVPDDSSTQLTSTLHLKDRTSGTAIVGLWARPHRRVEIGLAGRVIPVYLEAQGTMEVDKSTLVTDDIRVTMPLTLPATVRGGVRYIHEKGDRTWFDTELSAQWENWSTLDAYDVQVDGQISGQDVADLHLDKNWRDTISVRLGGDFHAIPEHLSVRAGGYWESATVPEDYAHLDFPSFMRVGVGAGLTAGGRGIYGTVGFLHVFQPDQEITELTGKVFQQRPVRPCPDNCNEASGVPANAGTFRSRYEILNIGLEIRFAELLGRRRGKGKKGKRGDAHAGPPIPPTAPDGTRFDPEQYAAPDPEAEDAAEDDGFGGFSG